VQQIAGGIAGARRGGISLDALVLILVTGYTLHNDSYTGVPYTTSWLNAIAVGLLGLYLALDVLLAPLAAMGARARRLFYGGKSVVLGGLIVLLLVWPTVTLIGQRHADGPATHVHDTSINVEEATKFLLAGKDPYAQTYFHTPLAQFGWYSGPQYGYGPNPALYWTDTFPAQEEITVPFILAARVAPGWFDERFIYLLALGVAILLMVRLAPTPTTRLALVAAVTLNPLFIPEFIYGQNDILVLAELLGVLFFSIKSRWRLALLVLAAGCATKQTTLLLVPIYLWWLALRLGTRWPARLERLALLLPWLAVPFILLVGPFAAWNWSGFYDGNFGYVGGTVPHSYPIQGYNGWGAASFALWSGLVPGPNSYFPFWVFEAGTALPLGVLLCRRMTARTPATVMFGAYATVVFPIFYFSRFFHASYVAFTISLLLVAYFAHRPMPQAIPGRAGAAEDGHISFDMLVPLLLVPQLIEPPNNRSNGVLVSITVGLLLVYVVVGALAPWGRLYTERARRRAVTARALVLGALAAVTVVSRAMSGIYDRLHWNVPFAFIHDTALQIQIAAGALLKGANPYTMSFWNTPLPHVYITPGMGGRARPDLPLTHDPHLPLGILIGALPQALFNALHLLFDECYLYLFFLLVAVTLLPLLVRVPARQLALLGAVLFSPLFARAVVQGQDDVLVLVALTAMLLLLRRDKYRAASFAAGVALALKITAWPLAPLLIVYIAALSRGAMPPAIRPVPMLEPDAGRRTLDGDSREAGGGRGRGGWRRYLARRPRLAYMLTVVGRSWGLLPPLLASMLPFILWDARAFWSDAVAYPLGLMRDAVPLDVPWGTGFQTLGFGHIALGAGWVHANGTGYIGPWFALIAGTLVFAVLAVRLWRAPHLPLLMGGYLVLLFVLEYFGRFMIDTSLGYLAVLAPLCYFLASPRPVAQAAPLPLPVEGRKSKIESDNRQSSIAASR